MKKFVALVIGLGLIFATMTAAWGIDADTPLGHASVVTYEVTLINH